MKASLSLSSTVADALHFVLHVLVAVSLVLHLSSVTSLVLHLSVSKVPPSPGTVCEMFVTARVCSEASVCSATVGCVVSCIRVLVYINY
jgi:hypothetical protein